MGKRDDQRKLKLCVLNKIKENKSILFGQLSQSVTKQVKIDKWKEINTYAQSIGAVDGCKVWSHVRDVWWPNVRKSSMEKIDNAKKTGTGGGKDKILNVVDEEVITIIGKDSPSIAGLNVSESMEHDLSSEPTPTPNLSFPEEINGSHASNSSFDETSGQACILPPPQPLNKKIGKKSEPSKEDIIDEKKQLQVELLKIQIYKCKLEARKLEMELGIQQSEFTKDVQTNHDSYDIVKIDESTGAQ